MRFILSLLLFCFTNPINGIAQSKYTVSGYIKEAATGENLIGATVFVRELSHGAVSNTYGFYSITLKEGTYTLVISYLGYQTQEHQISLTENIRLSIDLLDASIMAEEVVITGERADANIETTKMGTVELSVEEIKSIPSLLGEVDVLKTLQLLPGVQTASEGSAGLFVRGSSSDQTLLLLDEAVVYNAAHLFGFFSVFNADAVHNVSLMKGGMPANYGGRIASVVDVTMKEGNNKKFQAEGGIGIIASRLTLQGPIKKGQSSFIVTGRRTYIDVLVKPFVKKGSAARNSGYHFYDFNTKINYKLSDKDRIYLSGYFGRDKFLFASPQTGFTIGIPWGNVTSTLRWNHLFNDKLFMNAMALYSNYEFELNAQFDQFEFKMFSGIRDYNAKVDFDYFPNIKHQLKFGANYTYHIFTPNNASGKSGDVEFNLGDIKKQYANDAAVYITDKYELTNRIKIDFGLRYAIFQQVGPWDEIKKDERNNPIDTISYSRLENVVFYHGLEPRVAMRLELNNTSSIKASYNRNNQFIHLASASGSTLPTDIWVPSTKTVKPEKGSQYALGYFRNFKDNVFESSIEVYYKDMNNLIEFADGAVPDFASSAEDDFIFGIGYAYGIELFIRKQKGKFTGWAGYTLAWTTKQFNETNDGKPFPAKYDRRHDIGVVGMYRLNEKWSFSTTFVYATGNAYWLKQRRYFVEATLVPKYGERNGFRMPSYHRIDIGATYHKKKSDKYESSWNFGVYNVYNRKNPYFMYLSNEGDLFKGTLSVKAYKVSIFPFLPSVTWNFKF